MDLLLSLHRSGAVALFLLPFLLACFSLQQPSILAPVYTNCLRNATEPLTATFRANLNTTLRNFTSLADQGTTYADARSDTLYSMFQCRGDLSSQSCATCMQNITAQLPLACPLAVGARKRLDGCFLRYDNEPIFDLDFPLASAKCNKVTTSDGMLLTRISDALESAITQAPNSPKLFASVSQNSVYAMAECWRFVNESDCARCLMAYLDIEGCNATIGKQLHFGSCDYRFEIYNFLEATSSPRQLPSPAPSPAAAAPPAPSSSSADSTNLRQIILILCICIGGVILMIIGAICGILWWHYQRRRIKDERQLEKQKSLQQKFMSNAKRFSLEELKKATCHFDSANKLGKGGFGNVYKGMLACGDLVAVKKLNRQSKQGIQEFVNEVNLMTSVHHKNLIKLLGYSVEGDERILVYEYLPNKSLDYFLSKNAEALTWSRRFHIIVGMAKGLQYLHEESQIRIIHRDIKPSNILLDDDLNAIIADFGIARLVQDDETHVNTGVAGTLGYMSPEYVMRGTLSEKADIYSFGLVALELVTGLQRMPGHVLIWAWQHWQQQRAPYLVDNKLHGGFSVDEAVRVVHVALLCTQQDPRQRPRMSTVTQWLMGASAILDTPIKPDFANTDTSLFTSPIRAVNECYLQGRLSNQDEPQI